jgi:hypothetical protein
MDNDTEMFEEYQGLSTDEKTVLSRLFRGTEKEEQDAPESVVQKPVYLLDRT